MRLTEKKKINYIEFRRKIERLEPETKVHIVAERLSERAQIEMAVMIKWGVLVPDPTYLAITDSEALEKTLEGEHLLADMVYIRQPYRMMSDIE